ncbi:MAG: hypothetical protein AABZ47_15425 [Planctomycetota bacterium]
MTSTILSASLAWLVVTLGSNDAAFIPLRDPQGIYWQFEPTAISANGLFVAGAGIEWESGGAALLTWTDQSFQLLTPISSSSNARAVGLSEDGRTVVGYLHVVNGIEGILWQDGNSISLGVGVVPQALSTNGDIIVGYRLSSGANSVAFHLTRSSGQMVDIPLDGFMYSTAVDVSGDGRVVVVVADNPLFQTASNSSIQNQAFAFRWTVDESLVEPIDPLSGGTYFSPTSISANGSVIVGYGDSNPSTYKAIMWTEKDGTQSLDTPSFLDSYAYDVSANGEVIVGYKHVTPISRESFIWDELNGMRLLRPTLEKVFSLSLDDWLLPVATRISADGRVIVGSGISPYGAPEAYLVQLPSFWFEQCEVICDDNDFCTRDSCTDGVCDHSPVRYGDIAPCGGDGTVDIDDLIAVLQAFAGQELCACTP